MSRAFTGAWVETEPLQDQNAQVEGRAFTGAWVETGCRARRRCRGKSRLHGRVG